jgi:cytochrome c-type biogenesis protein CcmH
MRSELTTAMQRGDSDSLVLQGFVQKYGTTVLAAPTSSGFNRVAWIMPFVAFALSIGAVVVVIRTWKLRVDRNAIASQANAPIDIDEFRRRAREETEL